MTLGDKFISPEEVVRHKDGRLDLFNTILARKDTAAQVPVLTDTNARIHKTASQPSSTSITTTDESSNTSLLQRYPASAPSHASKTFLSEWKNKHDDNQQKRRQSRSPSPDSLSSDSIPGSGHTNKAARVIADVRALHRSPSPPRSNAGDSIGGIGGGRGDGGKGGGGGWGGRAFERIFNGYVDRPSTVPTEIAYWHDDDHLIIKDCYPKAKVHMLVLPRKRIEKLDKLAGSDGIRTVNQLVDRANWLLERLKKDSPHLTFKMGFHVIPSILQLHMHVISQDFCSDALKKKHHWNSFTSRFFISPDQVIKTLQERHTFTLTKKELDDYEGLLKMPLKCNQCNESPKNMPALKKHLEQHFFRLNG